MGTPLTGQTPAETYIDLLKISTSNAGLSSSLTRVSDGGGNDSTIRISTSGIDVSGSITLSGTALLASVADLNRLNRTSADGLVQASKVLVADNNKGIFTAGGDIDFISNGAGVSNGTVSNLGIGSFSFVTANLGTTSSININPESGSVFRATINSNSTPLTFSRPTFMLNDFYASVNRAYYVRLVVTQDATGGRDINWPSTGLAFGNLHFPSGQWTSYSQRYPRICPTGYTASSGEMDIFEFWSYDHGINWHGLRVSSGILRNG